MITKSKRNNKVNLVEDIAFFEGYASVFNILDYAGDIILPGAFSNRMLNGLKLLWQHDHKTPIGVIDKAYEDTKGLYVKGRIFTNLSQGKEAYILIKNQITDHLSIGYEVINSYYEGDIRYITKINLWEISVVTFPANRFAEITDMKEMRQLNDNLRRAIGVLKSQYIL